jgi:hypothetical protein
MAKKRISYKRKKHNRKSDNIEGIPTTHVPLCAMGEVIKGKHLFSPIHQLVNIPQKRVEYTPTDKLVFATLSIAAGVAHNLIIFLRSWLNDAMEASLFTGEEEPTKAERKAIALAQKTIQQRGIKRFIRQILAISGKVVVKERKVVCIFLNPLYPLINRIKTAFDAFLKPYNITVLLDEN